MAPPRSPDGLLARLAKAARAGVLPVLALVAALVLAGCGGGGHSSSGASTSATARSEADDPGAAQQGNGAKSGDKPSGSKQASNAPQPEGEREPGITSQQKSEVTTADIALESPAVEKGGATLAAKFTCDGKDTWPELRWKGLPPEAAELVLLVLSVRPVNEKLFFNWAVAGLNPGLKEIEEGKLPAGAVVGKNSFGKAEYSICPEAGSAETYIFMLFAIPKALDPKSGFDSLSLREEVLAEHGNVGLLSASYER